MKDFRELNNYIDNIVVKDGYEDIITVEHRSNNPKRDFLFVNRNQCKHIPSSPTQFIKMCCELSEIITNNVKADNILVIGFAETATAIGTMLGIALPNAKYIMHTTREEVLGSKEIITFEEEHSHATTQKLLGFEGVAYDFSKYDYILFVDDEISTGKTILNFIDAFEKQLNSKAKYGVASICNWQSEDNIQKFSNKGIDRFYLISGQLKDDKKKLDLRDKQIIENFKTFDNSKKHMIETVGFGDKIFKACRLGHSKNLAVAGCNYIQGLMSGYHKIRIIGTEEFMHIPIVVGNALESSNHEVICHATTRSKIDVVEDDSRTESEIIKCRYELPSAYEKDRKTYIYNTNEPVDAVIVITDTPNREQLELFINELKKCVNCKNDIIYTIKY